MTIESGTALTIALSFVGAVVWLIRLEGRVTKNEALHTELKEHVEYIRARIDELLSRRR